MRNLIYLRPLGHNLVHELKMSMTLSFRPSIRTWENNAYSSRTNKDNLTKFYMQLYWLIPNTFCFMTFDLRGQI